MVTTSQPLTEPALRRGVPWAKMIRFGIVGALGTVVNVLILHLLFNELGWGFTRSSAIATEVAIVHNYVWNELWTFHVRKLNLRRLLQYNASSLASFVVTVVVATIVKEFIDARAAQLVGILAGAGINFLVNNHWTWGRSTNQPSSSHRGP